MNMLFLFFKNNYKIFLRKTIISVQNVVNKINKIFFNRKIYFDKKKFKMIVVSCLIIILNNFLRPEYFFIYLNVF